MKRDDWKDLIELLGVIAIVASLIFVGVQVQQGAAATRSATVLQLKDSWVQLNLASATSLDLAKAFETVDNEGWDADRNSRALVGGFYLSLLHNWSNAYYQYRNGTLEEDQWMPHMREMESNANNPILKKIWPEWRHVYDDHFRKVMEAILIE